MGKRFIIYHRLVAIVCKPCPILGRFHQVSYHASCCSSEVVYTWERESADTDTWCGVLLVNPKDEL